MMHAAKALVPFVTGIVGTLWVCVNVTIDWLICIKRKRERSKNLS